MPNHNQDEEMMPNLTAVFEVLMVLFVCMAMLYLTQVSGAVLPSGPVTHRSKTASHKRFVARVELGPDRAVKLNHRLTTLHQLVGDVRKALNGQSPGELLLRATDDVDLGFYWDVRFALREAGLGYVEARPETEEP